MFHDNLIGPLVKLPRLSGRSAVVLAEQLLSAAAEEIPGRGVPLHVERQRLRLQTAVAAMRGELRPESPGDAILTEADLTLAEAWRLFSAWLGASAWLPEGLSADQERLRDLYALLFEGGLSEVVSAYREEWILSEMRLRAMADGHFEPLIERLSGGAFMTYIKVAHAKFEEVLALDDVEKSGENPVARRCLADLHAEIKSYVLKATAIADADDPASEFLSAQLLAPLSQWADTSQSYRDTMVDDEPLGQIAERSAD